MDLTNIKFGWHKDPYDDRDLDYRRKIVKLPRVYQNPVVPPILNQYYWGSCVGKTWASILAGEAAIDGKDVKFSAWWIYNGARFIEGSLLEDVGCYPRDALDWMQSRGCLLNHHWPYTPRKFDTSVPNSDFFPAAAEWPLFKYYRVRGGVESMCDVLASGHYVGLGTPWPSRWTDTYNGIVRYIGLDEPMAGGHAYYFYGYDMDKQVFDASNSWGEEYGLRGRFRVPFQAFDFFRYYGGYDAHYIDVHWQDTPQPIKKTCWDRLLAWVLRRFKP